MPCPHNEITIVQRSQRQSAVAAAAYQSGEKLFCEYDQQVKHYPEKRGIVHNEILLPANAPQEYADRNTLWNAAEAVEKQWNSQLARRWVLKLRASLEKERERRIKINTRIESLERRIQEAEAAEVNEMVRTAKVTPEQLAALLRQSATSTPNPAALSAVGATIDKEDPDNEDDE